MPGGRKKREKEINKQLIAGLQELLAKAEIGELRALCYGGIYEDGQTVTLGVLNDERTGLHEMIGVSQMLSDALLHGVGD